MRQVDAAGADQVGRAPGAGKGGDVGGEGDHRGGQAIESGETQRGGEQDFSGFGAAGGCGGNGGAEVRGIADEAEHNLRLGVVGDDVGSAAAGNGADIQGAAAEQRIFGQGNLPEVVQEIEKRVDGGMAELGIGGVRELSLRGDFVAQRALGAERQTVFGGLAVDEEARAAGMRGGGLGAGGWITRALSQCLDALPAPGERLQAHAIQQWDDVDHGHELDSDQSVPGFGLCRYVYHRA